MDSLKTTKKNSSKKLILKSQQRFRSIVEDNVSTKEINKIAMSANNDQRMKSIYSVETYECEKAKTYYMNINKLTTEI